MYNIPQVTYENNRSRYVKDPSEVDKFGFRGQQGFNSVMDCPGLRGDRIMIPVQLLVCHISGMHIMGSIVQDLG